MSIKEDQRKELKVNFFFEALRLNINFECRLMVTIFTANDVKESDVVDFEVDEKSMWGEVGLNLSLSLQKNLKKPNRVKIYVHLISNGRKRRAGNLIVNLNKYINLGETQMNKNLKSSPDVHNLMKFSIKVEEGDSQFKLDSLKLSNKDQNMTQRSFMSYFQKEEENNPLRTSMSNRMIKLGNISRASSRESNVRIDFKKQKVLTSSLFNLENQQRSGSVNSQKGDTSNKDYILTKTARKQSQSNRNISVTLCDLYERDSLKPNNIYLQNQSKFQVRNSESKTLQNEEIKNLREEKEKQREEMGELRRKCEQLSQKLEGKNNLIDQLESQMQEIEKFLTKEQDKNRNLSHQQIEKDRQYQEHQQRWKITQLNLESELDKVIKKNYSMEIQNKKLLKSIEVSKEQRNLKIDKILLSINSIVFGIRKQISLKFLKQKKSIKNLTQEVKIKEIEIFKLESKILDMKNQKMKHQKLTQSLSRISVLSNQNYQLESQVRKLKEYSDDLVSEIRRQRQICKEVNRECQDVKQEFQETQKREYQFIKANNRKGQIVRWLVVKLKYYQDELSQQVQEGKIQEVNLKKIKKLIQKIKIKNINQEIQDDTEWYYSQVINHGFQELKRDNDKCSILQNLIKKLQNMKIEMSQLRRLTTQYKHLKDSFISQVKNQQKSQLSSLMNDQVMKYMNLLLNLRKSKGEIFNFILEQKKFFQIFKNLKKKIFGKKIEKLEKENYDLKIKVNQRLDSVLMGVQNCQLKVKEFKKYQQLSFQKFRQSFKIFKSKIYVQLQLVNRLRLQVFYQNQLIKDLSKKKQRNTNSGQFGKIKLKIEEFFKKFEKNNKRLIEQVGMKVKKVSEDLKNIRDQQNQKENQRKSQIDVRKSRLKKIQKKIIEFGGGFKKLNKLENLVKKMKKLKLRDQSMMQQIKNILISQEELKKSIKITQKITQTQIKNFQIFKSKKITQFLNVKITEKIQKISLQSNSLINQSFSKIENLKKKIEILKNSQKIENFLNSPLFVLPKKIKKLKKLSINFDLLIKNYKKECQKALGLLKSISSVSIKNQNRLNRQEDQIFNKNKSMIFLQDNIKNISNEMTVLKMREQMFQQQIRDFKSIQEQNFQQIKELRSKLNMSQETVKNGEKNLEIQNQEMIKLKNSIQQHSQIVKFLKKQSIKKDQHHQVILGQNEKKISYLIESLNQYKQLLSKQEEIRDQKIESKMQKLQVVIHDKYVEYEQMNQLRGQQIEQLDQKIQLRDQQQNLKVEIVNTLKNEIKREKIKIKEFLNILSEHQKCAQKIQELQSKVVFLENQLHKESQSYLNINQKLDSINHQQNLQQNLQNSQLEIQKLKNDLHSQEKLIKQSIPQNIFEELEKNYIQSMQRIGKTLNYVENAKMKSQQKMKILKFLME